MNTYLNHHITKIITCYIIIGATSAVIFLGGNTDNKVVSKVKLSLPPIIYAVSGIETNVYFDNVTLTLNISNFVFDVSCEKGLQQNERWTDVPSDTDAGDYPFSIKVLDANNKITNNAQSVVRVVPADSGKGRDMTLLCIGDSLTHTSVYTGHLLEITKSELVGNTSEININ